MDQMISGSVLRRWFGVKAQTCGGIAGRLRSCGAMEVSQSCRNIAAPTVLGYHQLL